MTKLTADQIYEAYRMKMIDGATVKEITVKTGITGTNIYSVFNTVPKYLTKRPPSSHEKRMATAYIEAANRLLTDFPNIPLFETKTRGKRRTRAKREQPAELQSTAMVPLTDSPDRFMKLNQAFITFQSVVAEFIDEEYQAKQEKLIKEFSELKTLHEVVTIENQELRKIAQEKGGFMNRLKIRFGYKPQVDTEPES